MVEFPVYVLRNSSGSELTVTSYGCTVLSLKVPDRYGKLADVVLGFSELERYPLESPHFGCVVGRFGNRIAAGRFTLEGKQYHLACNNHPGGIPCHLHGGFVGFDKVLWDAERVERDAARGVRFSRVSPDGEEGYPGELKVDVTYWFTDGNDFEIEYRAVTDRTTIVNLTHHSYFNLKGEGEGDILDHEIQIHADQIVPVGPDLIPVGTLQGVEGGPLDFRSAYSIGERIETDNQQLEFARGYDHCWVCRGESGELNLAAEVYEPKSGRTLLVLTTEPGIQFYSGNFLDGTLVGKNGRVIAHRGGLCLEPQHFPDSPNHPEFPSVTLRPEQEYFSRTVYRFGVR